MSQGFDPVGSKPVDSIGANGLVGTYFQPAVGVLVLDSPAAGPASNVSPAKLSGVQRETLFANSATAKVGGVSREALIAKTSVAKISGIVREVLRSGATGSVGDNCWVSIIWGQ